MREDDCVQQNARRRRHCSAFDRNGCAELVPTGLAAVAWRGAVMVSAELSLKYPDAGRLGGEIRAAYAEAP
jgi:hypothetical protein